ncbi:uncharacterized protein LOC125026445 isoform X2 [Penaeus chinensis]|uniref:uncharacterized protein LOC125026445 isoform X2 n=1 Tax=Penaeus chinensis TaxID=139456 RepID=UPI001FB762A4|nr:uncharacterized protein LOC125026445 isoform X2 [Penaeus chinensis]
MCSLFLIFLSVSGVLVEGAPGDTTHFPDDLFNLDDYEEIYYDGMYDDYDYNYDLDGDHNEGDNQDIANLVPSVNATSQPTVPDSQPPPVTVDSEHSAASPGQEASNDSQPTDNEELDDILSKLLFFGPQPVPTESQSQFRGDLPPSLDSEEDVSDSGDLQFNLPLDDHSQHNVSDPAEGGQLEESTQEESLGGTGTMPPVFLSLPVVEGEIEDSGSLNITDETDYGDDDGDTEAAPEFTTGVETTPSLTNLVTVQTPVPQTMNSWTWFYIILSGKCLRVNFNDDDLISDFIASFSSLLLYDREYIVVDSMSCSNDEMTVNMSVDSNIYPNCENDLGTLLSHRNIRIKLHNTSFYMESFETKRSLIFETKPEKKEDKPDILLFTLIAVGISLLCLLIAGLVYAVYQCTRAKTPPSDPVKYAPESPRSLRPKFETEQGIKASEKRPRGVNMYRSYSDLSAPDLYSHLGSFDSTGSARSEMSAVPTAHLKISLEKKKKKDKKKKKKKKKDYDDSGLSDIAGYEEMWTESLTETSEEFMTIRNLNPKASTFKAEIKESEKDSLDPLLRNIHDNTSQEKDNKSVPPIDSTESSTNCPSPSVVKKDVLKSLDDLISSSNPDINSYSAYSATYSNTTINISSASSAIFSTTNTSSYAPTDSSPMTYTSTNTSSFGTTEGKPSSSATSASAENLCLTRITFMEMCVWPHQTELLLSSNKNSPTGMSQK